MSYVTLKNGDRFSIDSAVLKNKHTFEILNKNSVLILKSNLKSDPTGELTPGQSDFLMQWLRWVQSDDNSSPSGSSKPFWQYMNIEKKKTEWGYRDEYVLSLLNTIDSKVTVKNPSNPGVYKEFIGNCQNRSYPWAYYQNHFFYWFLRRYRLDYARQVYGFCSNGAWLIPLIMFLLSVAGLWVFSQCCSGAAWLLPAVGYFMILAMMNCCGLPLLNAIQSLIPRLAATALVGFLFLVTADSVVNQVLKNPSFWFFVYSAVAILISTGYLMLEIAHRLEPGVPLMSLIKRAGMVVVTGFSHSTLIVLLGYPLLTAIEHDFSTLLLLVSINMGIGIILNNVWEENPVTEPL